MSGGLPGSLGAIPCADDAVAERVSAPSSRTALRRASRHALFAVIAVSALAAWRWHATLAPAAISATIRRSPVAPLAFLAVNVATGLFFVPRTTVAIAGGLLWGLRWGIFWTTLGGVAGAAAAFLAARYINAGLIDPERVRYVGPVLAKVERGGWRAVAVLRLVPVMPQSVTSYGLGLTRLPLAPYLVGSVVGQLPATITYVAFGAAGERLMLGRAGWLVPALIGLVALALSLLIPARSRRRAR